MSIIAGHADFDNITIDHSILSVAVERVLRIGGSQKFSWLFEDFDGDPIGYGNSTKWNPAAGLVNGSVIAGDEAGGSAIFSTSGTANSTSGLAPANAICGNLLTKPFYLAARAKVTTTPDAVSKHFIGFTDATNTVGLGIIGPLSATDIKLQHSANLATTGASMGVAIDTAYHTYEVWGNGADGKIYGSVDQATPVSVTPTVTYLKGRILVTAKNGATAADQRLQMDYLFVAAGR